MKKIRKLVFIISALLLMFNLIACSKKNIDESLIAKLTDYTIETQSNGSEDSQKILLTLNFDREVEVKSKAADELRVTVGGERMDSEDISISKDGDNSNVLVMTIKTNAVYEGDLNIEAKDKDSLLYKITTTKGDYPTESMKINCLVPSGVALETVESISGNSTTNAKISKRVTNGWNIRSILWIRLLENGNPAKVTESAEQLDGAIAVHGHEFLMLGTPESAAKVIIEALEEAYGDSYTFTCDKDIITAESKEAGDKVIDLEVYLY